MATIEFNDSYLRDMTEIAERSKSNTHRIDAIENDIKSLQEDNRTLYEMSASIKTLADNVGDIRGDVKEIKTEQTSIKAEVQDMKNAPTKTKAGWFDSIWKTVVSIAGGALVGWLISVLFPQIAK